MFQPESTLFIFIRESGDGQTDGRPAAQTIGALKSMFLQS